MVLIPIRDKPSTKSFPLITVLLVAANFVVFFLELTSPSVEEFILTYALVPAEVDFNDVYSLIPFFTSMFLHAGWFHLLGNMWFLWIFGDNVEGKFGKINFVLFYLGMGFLAGLTQYLINTNSFLPILGASGAIAGVLGAYLYFFPRAKVENLFPLLGLPIVFDLPAYAVLLLWLFVQFVSGTFTIIQDEVATGGVAYWAHISGFFGGLFLSWLGRLLTSPRETTLLPKKRKARKF
jgi:membrane associated rhomboid family serine protease